MVYILENPTKIWMMTRGTPMTMEASISEGNRMVIFMKMGMVITVIEQHLYKYTNIMIVS